MSRWAIYSPEDYPKWDEENNCQADYRQALGVQVILKAHQWTELEPLGYKLPYYTSWVDAAGDAKEIFISSQQLGISGCAASALPTSTKPATSRRKPSSATATSRT